MSLHVGYLTGEYPRATDTWIQREVAGMRNRGVEITTFSIRRPGPEHVLGPEQREGQATTFYLLEHIKVGGLVSAHLRALVASPGRYLRSLRLAWNTKRPGLRGGIYQLFYFVEAVVLAQEMTRRRIDHLHNHFGDSSCTVAMLAAEVGGFPFSFTLHGSAIFFEAHTWRIDEKIRRSAFCACISHFARSQAAIFAPEATEKLHIVHCGVEPHRLMAVDHRGRGPRLLFIGRITAVKGLDVLLDAIDALQSRHTDLQLTIVGDGPERTRLEQKTAQRGLDAVVTFVGSKSQEEVSDLLTRTDVFVLPSFAEGVPVVLMEAMGAGLPVVATQVGGMTELVDDQVSGFLIRPFDATLLAERIDQLVSDPDLRRRLGQAGRKKVLDEFVSADEAGRLASLIGNHQAGVASPVRPSLPSA
ncbi:MAG: glycosyltransferase [Acidimicrobiia bacterium]|nr:glycosyltransferase [Acidimicrobiia bacterium]